MVVAMAIRRVNWGELSHDSKKREHIRTILLNTSGIKHG